MKRVCDDVRQQLLSCPVVGQHCSRTTLILVLWLPAIDGLVAEVSGTPSLGLERLTLFPPNFGEDSERSAALYCVCSPFGSDSGSSVFPFLRSRITSHRAQLSQFHRHEPSNLGDLSSPEQLAFRLVGQFISQRIPSVSAIHEVAESDLFIITSPSLRLSPPSISD